MLNKKLVATVIAAIMAISGGATSIFAAEGTPVDPAVKAAKQAEKASKDAAKLVEYQAKAVKFNISIDGLLRKDAKAALEAAKATYKASKAAAKAAKQAAKFPSNSTN